MENSSDNLRTGTLGIYNLEGFSMKTRTAILIGLIFIVSVGLFVEGFQADKERAKAFSRSKEIPLPEEIQRMLNDTGIERYNCGEVDGIVGKQTIEAWRNYQFDYYAQYGAKK